MRSFAMSSSRAACYLWQIHAMSTAKEEVQSLLSKLPDDCSLEDIQYRLYVIEKVRNGLDAAESQGTVSQEDVEQRFGKWLTE